MSTKRQLIIALLLVAATAQTAASQNSTTSRAASEAPGVSAAIEAYRLMWRGLTPEQQKQTLQSGGYTPEQYESMLRQNSTAGNGRAAPAPGTPDYTRGVSEGALDALGGSLRDLNAIRDANVLRLQKDGCPPEVASRIADLKGKLAAQDAELKGLPVSGSAPAAPRHAAADPIEVAQSWFKSAPGEAARNQAASDMLDSVLPGGMAETRARPSNSQSLEAGVRRNALSQEIARTEAEIERLQGACIAAKR